MIKVLLVALCIALTKADSEQAPTQDGSFVDDGDLNRLFGFSFFYHDTHNLLLTVTNDSCYYTSVLEGSEGEGTLLHHKTQVEAYVGRKIYLHQDVHQTTLEDVENTFKDLLADFHCVDKTVYTLDISLKEATSGGQHHQWWENLLAFWGHFIG